MLPWFDVASTTEAGRAVSQSSWFTNGTEPDPRLAKIDNINGLTIHQLHAIRVSSLVIACISVTCAFIASFWFFRMRRSFRHDLIMLVIQSDAFKAIWFMIYPVVEMASGEIDSDSSFCQASGFFLALGIEACDVAVVLVAIHTMLYIFRGRNGLYDFRWLAFGAWVFIPSLLASLAFINGRAYVNTGQFCYLPIVPAWPKRALSWIPRYVILATILVSYFFIYFYVTVLMYKFGNIAETRRASDSLMESTTSERDRRSRQSQSQPSQQSDQSRQASLPTVPPIAYHGLVPSTPSSEGDSKDFGLRRVSGSPNLITPGHRRSSILSNLSQPPSARKRSDHSIPSAASRMGSLSSGPQGLERIESENDHTRDTTTTSGASASVPDDSAHVQISSSTSSSGPSQNQHPVVVQRTSNGETPNGENTDTKSTARKGPASHIVTTLRHVARRATLRPEARRRSSIDPRTMDHTREKIRRQLRYLFIYPVVYILVWLFPFISHVIGGVTNGAPFWIVLVAQLSICAQGTLDALVFSFMEKPWKHPRRGPFGCRLRFWRGRRGEENINPNVGRSKEEMRVEGKLARKRRQEEIAMNRLDRATGQPSPPREWWDRYSTGGDDISGVEDIPPEDRGYEVV